jgi:hypothetical protein
MTAGDWQVHRNASKKTEWPRDLDSPRQPSSSLPAPCRAHTLARLSGGGGRPLTAGRFGRIHETADGYVLKADEHIMKGIGTNCVELWRDTMAIGPGIDVKRAVAHIFPTSTLSSGGQEEPGRG